MEILLRSSRLQTTVFRYARARFSSRAVAVEGEKELFHTPVMAEEVLESLDPVGCKTLIDMTFGGGGHSRRILKSAANVKLFALDRDPVAHSLARDLANQYPDRVVPLLGRFSELPSLLASHGVRRKTIDGILFDFGCSSMQFDVAERGFSLSKNGPLDMRMDGSRFPNEPTAADVLARCEEHHLAKVLKVYGEEKQAKKIARAVVDARYTFKRLETTRELAELVATVCSNEQRLDKLNRPAHSATKTFQALRILVNNELNEINYAMIVAHAYLKFGGRLVTLTFHSLEDRIIKRHLSGNVVDNAINPLPLKYANHSLCHDKEEVEALFESNWKLMHRHVLTPTPDEINLNPRSRSAKLRAAIKVK